MIFEDPSHRRWRRAVIVFSLLSVAAAIALGITVTGRYVAPRIPNPFRSRPEVQATAVKASLEHDARPVYTAKQQKRMQALRVQERRRRDKLTGDVKAKALPLPQDAVVGFVVQDDANSVASLEHHVGDIDVVVPDWFELPGADCELNEKIDDKTRRVLARSDAVVLPRVANLSGNVWRGAETSKMLASDSARACVVQKLVQRLSAIGASGVNLDLEELRPEDSENFLELLVNLRLALHAKSMRLTVDVPFHDPAFDVEYIGNVSDAVMVMAYDQHYPASRPGPIASREWINESLDEMLPRLPPDRVVVVLGSYGYDWSLAEPPPRADELSFRQVMDLARAADAKPVFETELENGHFAYKDGEGETHDVWFQDALSSWNQVLDLQKRHVARVGIWRLGTEDETLWSFLDDTKETSPNVLASVPPVKSVGLMGNGEVYTIRSEPQAGSRNIVADASGRIEHGVYDKVPSGYVVERRGASGKQIALTFDDGPDERNTGKLLDVLHDLKVPAAFFVIGENVMRAPELVVREAREGHLVGNHTYNHPHLEGLTPREAAGQLTETQRLVEGLTGIRSPLFRGPYTTTIEPDRPDDLAVLRVALAGGYLFVGANVDPDDWQPDVTAQTIVKRIVDELTASKGSIILMHDGGGDKEDAHGMTRAATIEAVKLLVPELRKRGYEIVSLDKLLGVPRSDLAAALPAGEGLLSKSDAYRAYAYQWGWVALGALFFACTVLSILRILFLGALTLKNVKPKASLIDTTGFEPLVSIIVPAYNEGKVISTTLRSLLATSYKNFEILVIDDGSTDDTAEVVEAMSLQYPAIRLLRQTNGGKSKAANHALGQARGDIVVAVDADTMVAPEAIPKMVAHFASPDVTAVCGNIAVGNVNGIFTTFQAIEYVTSQNFDRRAYSALNCISVVPGALGAWRRQAVIDAGGYSEETLTEDADLTLAILRNGGRVVYEPDAHGMTEAPESLTALLKQRFRWTYGTYQCLWKHRTGFFKGTLGWIGLPNMVIFQVLFPLVSPIGDFIMVLSIWRGDWKAFLAGYVAFLVMDICGSLLAFTLDHKPLKWLPLLLVQRFTYRQIMYYICFKAMIAAVKGARHGWKKLDRTGSVEAAQNLAPA
ncbi:MAG TPA: glycosyltransferase [Polyangiaceae bacterium]|jgi:cellulose synthase/poly-beta-1,6-N-acetylglucosamine synthase-like glycosyltransferase/peptidoglycan/xylan/chitin deacetylase (PgdA/CDA1 family)/spore germination protein YaaH|nr:glycosyltransferase [Polyangiaceae bacterium]